MITIFSKQGQCVYLVYAWTGVKFALTEDVNTYRTYELHWSDHIYWEDLHALRRLPVHMDVMSEMNASKLGSLVLFLWRGRILWVKAAVLNTVWWQLVLFFVFSAPWGGFTSLLHSKSLHVATEGSQELNSLHLWHSSTSIKLYLCSKISFRAFQEITPVHFLIPISTSELCDNYQQTWRLEPVGVWAGTYLLKCHLELQFQSNWWFQQRKSESHLLNTMLCSPP